MKQSQMALKAVQCTIALGAAVVMLHPAGAARKRNTRVYYAAPGLSANQREYQREQAFLRSQQGQSKQKQNAASQEWQAMLLGELDGAVNLTSDQKASIRPMLQDEARQISTLSNNQNLSTQAKQDRLQQIQQASWSKISKVLTPDQQQRLDEAKGDQTLDNLSKQLNLTEDQKAKIRPLLQDEAKQTASLEKDTTLTKEDKKTKSQAIDDTTWEQIEAILTPDQQQKLDEIRQDSMVESLTKSLNLTTDEKTKVKQALADTLPQIRAIREDQTLTSAVKEDKLQGVRDTMWQQVYAALTSEQQKKLESLRYGGTAGGGASTQSSQNLMHRRKRN